MMNQRTRIVKLGLKALCLSLALGDAAGASAATSPKAEVTALRAAAIKLGAEYDANYAKHDPQAMAALYAPDGVLVSPAGNIIHGHDALLAYYTQRFANGAVAHHITVKEVHVQGNGGYGIAHIAIDSKDAGGKIRTETGNLVAVYVKSDDGWHFRLVEPSIPPKNGA